MSKVVKDVDAAVDQELLQAPCKARLPKKPKTEHLAKYQFPPGKSGNPGGRAGKDSVLISKHLRWTLGELNGSKARLVAQTLIEIALDKKHPQCVRAHEVLLERTEGKVKQHMEHGGAIGVHRIELVGLTPEELERAQDLAGIPETTSTGEEPEGEDG